MNLGQRRSRGPFFPYPQIGRNLGTLGPLVWGTCQD